MLKEIGRYVRALEQFPAHELILSQVNMMKTTITVRFTFNGIEVDNEADCRFYFLLEKRQGRWGVCFYTLLFDKDKMVPVHPGKSFDIPEKEVMKFPS